MGKKIEFRDMLYEAQSIIADYKKDNDIEDTLDGDEVDNIADVFRAYLNYDQGNITREELLDVVDKIRN